MPPFAPNPGDATAVCRKIVTNFLQGTVGYEHTKGVVAGSVCVLVSNSLQYAYVSAQNWQNWMTFHKVITNIKEVTFFETPCRNKQLLKEFEAIYQKKRQTKKEIINGN